MIEFVVSTVNKVKYPIIGIYLVLVFWVPINNFDSLAAYLARFTYERFGPLSETGTLTIQSTFPRTFDILFLPFMNWGWFEALPSLILTGIYFICLRYWFKKDEDSFSISLLILFCLPVFIVTISSAKNDAALGIFSFAAITLSQFMPNSQKFKLTCILLTLSLLIGTKWHGFFLAGLILALTIATQLKNSEFKNLLKQIPYAILASPVMAIFADLPTYVRNFNKYGTPFPLSPELLVVNDYSFSFTKFLHNFFSIGITWFAETFDSFLLVVPLSAENKSVIWDTTNRFLFNPRMRLGIFENAEISTVGIMGILILVISFKKVEKLNSVYFPLQIISFFYFLILVVFFKYSEWINRYFLPIFMLLLPLMISRVVKFRRKLLSVFLAFSLLLSTLSLGRVLLFGQEHPLISASYFDPYAKGIFAVKSIFYEGKNRQAIRFQTWAGYKEVLAFYESNISEVDSLLVVSNSKDYLQAPFLEPFLRFRKVENTSFINEPDNFEWTNKYVMIYKRHTAIDKRYELVYLYPGIYQIEIFKIKEN